MSASEAHGFVQDLQCDTSKSPCSNTPRMPSNPPAAPHDFTAADFTRAQGQLIDELGYVSRVRDYLSHLAYPLGDSSSTDPWEQAQTLESNLTQQLKNTDWTRPRFSSTSWGSSSRWQNVAGLLLGVPDVGSLAAKAAKAFKTIATASEFAKVFIDAKYGGAPGPDIDSGNIQANKLGERLLQAEAQATATSFKRMGDIIVSDWSKLQELGQQRPCQLQPGPGCGWRRRLRGVRMDGRDRRGRGRLGRQGARTDHPQEPRDALIRVPGLGHRAVRPVRAALRATRSGHADPTAATTTPSTGRPTSRGSRPSRCSIRPG